MLKLVRENLVSFMSACNAERIWLIGLRRKNNIIKIHIPFLMRQEKTLVPRSEKEKEFIEYLIKKHVLS